MNSKILTPFLAVIGLLILALLARNGDLAWLALPFLAYLGVGILQAQPRSRLQLTAERSVEKTAAGEKASVHVCVAVRNIGPAVDQLVMSDTPQPGMALSEGQLWRRLSLPRGGEARLEYTFLAERGNFAWKTVQVQASDALGLLETCFDLPAPAEIQVQPEVKKFKPFPLRPQRTVHARGAIPARTGGTGIDFWGVREYHPGDPLRRLDWRKIARHPREIFTKEFEQEEIADIGLILDGRQKMDLCLEEDSLFEHTSRAAASLAEVFLRTGNRVSLLIYGEPMVSIFPGYGKRQLNRILRALANAIPEPGGSLNSLQYLPTQMFTSQSLILVISPLAANDWLLFPRLRAYGYQVLLVSP
ncbi:MAG TPA: DUF58 domain-containing protein, partial [Anaerolineaceae bacterium]